METNEKVKKQVTRYQQKEVAASEAGTHKLSVRLEKCIQLNGDYVEKIIHIYSYKIFFHYSFI